ncbi:MAG: hypothetical protein GX675_04870 [Erysipelotrichaceae bacterium]|nr:hypothetical protein [Erysipelotrichaceae bacterium]
MEEIYRLYDFYEGQKLLIKTASMTEVRAAARQRDEDTDGECYLVLICNGGLVQDWNSQNEKKT